jgi:hypothetical protein
VSSGDARLQGLVFDQLLLLLLLVLVVDVRLPEEGRRRGGVGRRRRQQGQVAEPLADVHVGRSRDHVGVRGDRRTGRGGRRGRARTARRFHRELVEGAALQLLGLHAAILEPDLDLSLRQVQRLRQLDSTRTAQVAICLKSKLHL